MQWYSYNFLMVPHPHFRVKRVWSENKRSAISYLVLFYVSVRWSTCTAAVGCVLWLVLRPRYVTKHKCMVNCNEASLIVWFMELIVWVERSAFVSGRLKLVFQLFNHFLSIIIHCFTSNTSPFQSIIEFVHFLLRIALTTSLCLRIWSFTKTG